MTDETRRTDDEWRRALTPEQYAILREKATERPWSGEYNTSPGTGTYRCVGCGSELFRSGAKYDSGSGWPSFWAPASDAAVATEQDASHGMIRTEVLCGSCNGHLGHLFPDGPRPSGLRYCINSRALAFEPETDD